MRWIVSLSIVLMACGGPQVPTHNGYKPKDTKPWLKPKVLKFDDKREAKIDADISYPAMKRARWYQLDLPSSGQLAMQLEVVPPGDAVNDDFDLAFEVLDPSLRVIAKSDLEDEDAHELNKKKTLVDLLPGRYLVHVYAQGRLDTAEFSLRATFKSTAAAEAKTNFPSDVLFVPTLPLVPLQDDTPAGYTKQAVVKTTRKPRAPAPPPPPAAEPVVARIIGVQVVSGGTVITLGRGKASGASDGMKAKIKGIAGEFAISNCNERTCTATVTATPDQINGSNGSAVLTP